MKKIMAIVFAVLFVSSLTAANLVFAEGAVDKAAAPMSDNSKDGAKVSKDAKQKSKEAKMHKKGKKSKKSKKRNKKKS